ncbi:MAG TPA: ABC transporter substrate-binding protein [Acidimicrobiales bacterium]|nr:ABC transporter substrate-binding protein [Acidimicrobiales bacterium]
MSTTDEKTTTGGGGDAPPPPPTWTRAVKRYGPIVAIVVLIAGAVVVFGGGGGDDDTSTGSDETSDREALVSSGPMTPEKAELEGETDVDFGPNCDTETGRIKLVSVYAPPCVEPFTGDNGGDTYPGVTADEIKVVYYQADPALDPLNTSAIAGAGAQVDPESAALTAKNFVALYNKLFETYGRTVVLETYRGTGAGSDATAAKFDAQAIAEMEPFAVIGGPAQSSPVFATEIASHDIVCGPGCAIALNEDIVNDLAPYAWQVGATPNQAAALASEMVAKLAGPGKAELAGDDATKAMDRVYGLLHYDTPDGDHQVVFEAFKQSLEDNGIEIATDVEFTLDLARAQENARTNIGKLRDAGVTTIIYYGDPLTPASLTEEATAQNYHPEWILGPNTLMDTTIFARQTDVNQWQNGFGIALTVALGKPEDDGAFKIYDWAYGGLPPNNTANVLEPPIRTMFTGIHLAGPDLNPETFRDGLLRYPPSGGGPTEPQVSRGEHGVWPDFDWGGSDDIGLIWFDPTTSGEDEVGNEGQGMYRYALNGQRYTLGHLPGSIEEAGLFDVNRSVTVFDQVPEEDRTEDYPPPE